MKKFYSLVVASLLALSANANITVDDVVGNYEWTYNSELAFDTGRRNVNIEIVAGNTPGTVFIKGMYMDYTFVADIDAGAETLSIRSQMVDVDMSLGTIRLYCVVRDESDELAAYERPIVATVENDRIVFNPEEMIGIGFGELGMYYLLAGENVFAPGEDKFFVYNPDEWEEAGTGRIVDGWLSYHYLGIDNSSVEWEVEYVVNKENPNLYCILNPFDYKTWKPYNEDKSAEGHIVFDIENPEFVKLRTYVYSGFTDPEFGKLYMYATDSHLHYVDGMSFEELLEQAPSSLSTLEDGVVTIPMPAFGHETRPVGHYGWGMAYSKLVMPEPKEPNPGEDGINSVEDDIAAEVVYYDLQGSRVTNPTSGIYIKKQGNRVEKIVK